MRWKGRRQSQNVEDRRGMTPGGIAVGGGLGGLLLVILYVVAGGDPADVMSQLGGSNSAEGKPSPEQDELKEFVSVVLADTEEVWTARFREVGRTYSEPKLVLFSGQVQSACGFASAAVGPFYCGEDRNLYIDLSFYGELKRRFGAGGDFAQAYVVAHEVGHHVQNLLGTMERVQSRRQSLSEREYNALSVRRELQSDYFAGVWAHHAQRMAGLDAGDFREAMDAASAIGDDNIQKQSQGYVVPDAFTHGSSEQRRRWFRKGWESGDMRRGDTFSVRDP